MHSNIVLARCGRYGMVPAAISAGLGQRTSFACRKGIAASECTTSLRRARRIRYDIDTLPLVRHCGSLPSMRCIPRISGLTKVCWREGTVAMKTPGSDSAMFIRPVALTASRQAQPSAAATQLSTRMAGRTPPRHRRSLVAHALSALHVACLRRERNFSF
jgi:hypothetical protein